MKVDLNTLHKLTLKEVQHNSFEILYAFHRYCVDNNLRYQLAYGTCLGAIRHKGFIPWDDDVDVMMPRPDYEKLEELISKNPIPGLELLSFKANKVYSSPLAKIHNPNTYACQHYSQIDRPAFGVYIDVFIVDGIPSGKFKQMMLFKIANVVRRCWGLSVGTWDYETQSLMRHIKIVCSSVFKLIGYRFWVRLYNNVSKYYDYDKQPYAGIVQFGEGIIKECHNRSMFEESVLMDFEGFRFFVPLDWNTYLSKMYGDYMQLPPISERVSKHGTDFYEFPASDVN